MERVLGGLSYLDANISGAKAFKASYAIESKLELDKSLGEEVRISNVDFNIVLNVNRSTRTRSRNVLPGSEFILPLQVELITNTLSMTSC